MATNLFNAKKKRPNLFIIGAPRCGTTSLASWLAEHPNIYFSPVKEPFFFSTDVHVQGVSSKEEYENLFIDAKPCHKIIAEASTSYLYSEIAVPNIEMTYPGAKYIVMVRSPIEMAISLYALNRTIGEEYIDSFEAAWRLSPQRRRGKSIAKFCRNPKQLDYQEICKLGKQVERLFASVPQERVLVLVLDDIKVSPRTEYLKVLEFLRLPDDGRQDFPVENIGVFPRWPKAQPIIMLMARGAKRMARLIGFRQKTGFILWSTTSKDYLRKVQVSRAFLEELLDYYRSDIEKLMSLLGRDLTDWVEPQRYIEKPWVKDS